jgi:serine/threonine-protein kinase
VLHQIGIGALGPVFRTYEPTRDRLVAVKVFRLDIVPEQAQALATALGRAAGASLFHPSIVEPIAAGVEGTLAYRAEEYVAAESLDVAMRHYAPAAIEKVLPFITQLAGAIDFARAAGVGHGGLHPRDIFVTPDDARATGFGVIEALEEVGIRAPVRRPYTAPERIDGHAWGTPADIFSLAAITFELLSGRRPAGAGTLIGSLPDGPHSAQLHTVLARAMDADPTRRYTSALAFAAALESAGRGEPEGSTIADVAAIAAPVVAAAPTGPVAPPSLAADAPVTPAVREQPKPQPESESESETVRATTHTSHSAPEPTLFDADDASITVPPLDRFADEFVEDVDPRLMVAHEEPAAQFLIPPEPEEPRQPAARGTPVPPIEPTEPHNPREPEEPVMYESSEPSRPAVLPTAIGVVLGLLLGFAGGYFVGSGDRVTSEPPASTAASAPAATTAATTGASGAASGAATREQAGQYSEQKVSPPATPPAGAAPSTAAAAPETKPPAEPPPAISESEPSRGAAPREAAPPPPRERARPNGSILVKSTPTHAGVMVNGSWRGRTPLTLEHMAFGKYVVRVVQPGYHVAQEEFTLRASDADHTYTARLEPTASAAATKHEPATPKQQAPEPAAGYVGSLYVDSRPRGATVLLDGKNIGVTPVTLDNIPIGSHVVRIEMTGKLPWSTATRVAAGETVRVTGSLEDRQVVTPNR